MRGPKVVIMGAGSLFFGRQAIWQMAHSEHLQTGTLALVDTEPVHLARMKALADRVVEHTGVPLKVGRALEGMPTHGQVPWLRALSGVSCSARAAAGWTAGVARTVDRLGLEAVCAAGWPGPPRCGVGGRDIFCGGVVCFPLE